MPQALGEGAAALPGNLHKTAIVCDLLEERQGAHGFGQFALVEIVFKLQLRVVDTQ